MVLGLVFKCFYHFSTFSPRRISFYMKVMRVFLFLAVVLIPTKYCYQAYGLTVLAGICFVQCILIFCMRCWFTCPSCGDEHVGIDFNYCSHCGERICWHKMRHNRTRDVSKIKMFDRYGEYGVNW